MAGGEYRERGLAVLAGLAWGVLVLGCSRPHCDVGAPASLNDASIEPRPATSAPLAATSAVVPPPPPPLPETAAADDPRISALAPPVGTGEPIPDVDGPGPVKVIVSREWGQLEHSRVVTGRFLSWDPFVIETYEHGSRIESLPSPGGAQPSNLQFGDTIEAAEHFATRCADDGNDVNRPPASALSDLRKPGAFPRRLSRLVVEYVDGQESIRLRDKGSLSCTKMRHELTVPAEKVARWKKDLRRVPWPASVGDAMRRPGAHFLFEDSALVGVPLRYVRPSTPPAPPFGGGLSAQAPAQSLPQEPDPPGPPDELAAVMDELKAECGKSADPILTRGVRP